MSMLEQSADLGVAISLAALPAGAAWGRGRRPR